MARRPRTNGNFLATDRVPETIFGIPVVASHDQYTDADIRFFEEHPDAGGYYDLGGQSDEEMQQDAFGGNAAEPDTFTYGAPDPADRDKWVEAANKLIAQMDADDAVRSKRRMKLREHRDALETRTAMHEASAKLRATEAADLANQSAYHWARYQEMKENETRPAAVKTNTATTAAQPATAGRSPAEAGAPSAEVPKLGDLPWSYRGPDRPLLWNQSMPFGYHAAGAADQPVHAGQTGSQMRRLILAAGDGNLDMDEAGGHLDYLHRTGDRAGSAFLRRALKNSGYEIQQIPVTVPATRDLMAKRGGWTPSADGVTELLELGDRSHIYRRTDWLPFWADSPDIRRDDPAWVDRNADRIITTDAFLRSKGGGPHDTSAYYTHSFPELFGYSAARHDPLGAVKSFFGMNDGKRTPVYSEGDVYYAGAPMSRQVGVRHKVSRPTDAQKAARRKRWDRAADIVRRYMEYSGPRKENIPVRLRRDGSWYPVPRASDLRQDANGGKTASWASDEDIDVAAEFITRKGHEGFRGTAYRPELGRNPDGTKKLGNWTVGHGHEFLADGSRVAEGTTMTEEASLALVKRKLRDYAARVEKEPWASKVTDAGARRAILDLGYMRPKFYNEGMSDRMATSTDPNFEVHDTYSRYFNGPAGVRNRRRAGLREFFGDTTTKYLKGEDGKYTRFFRGKLIVPKAK